MPTSTHTISSHHRYSRSSFTALGIGLVSTVVAAGTAILGQSMIRDHIRTGYPNLSSRELAEGVSFYVAALSIVGVLGVFAWATTLWLASRESRWARWSAIAFFVVGSSISAYALLVRDTSGDTGIPPFVGGIGMVPCVIGLLAVALMFRPVDKRGGSDPGQSVDRMI